MPEAEQNPTAIFARILEKHRVRMEMLRSPGRCPTESPSPTMIDLRFQEARLWALAFPAEAERVSFPLAWDPLSNPDDRDLAIMIVGVLAGGGNPKAEPLLSEIIRSNTERAASTATGVLAKGDLQGRHRELYRQRARRGDLCALDVLGDWVDPATKLLLEEIAARESGAKQEIASTSVRRIAWLESPDWARRVGSILESSKGMAFRDFDWALRVARNRSLPGLADLLRKRLREAEAEHVEFCKIVHGDADGCVVQNVYERDFTTAFQISYVDWNFDDVLRAYAEIGGVLTELEQQRLHYLGYGTDPRKRLFEFVATWK